MFTLPPPIGRRPLGRYPVASCRTTRSIVGVKSVVRALSFGIPSFVLYDFRWVIFGPCGCDALELKTHARVANSRTLVSLGVTRLPLASRRLVEISDSQIPPKAGTTTSTSSWRRWLRRIGPLPATSSTTWAPRRSSGVPAGLRLVASLRRASVLCLRFQSYITRLAYTGQFPQIMFEQCCDELAAFALQFVRRTVIGDCVSRTHIYIYIYWRRPPCSAKLVVHW